MALTGEFLGTDTTLEYLVTGPSTYFAFTTYSNEGSMEETVGEAETTSYGTGQRTYIPGLRDNTFSFKVFHNIDSSLTAGNRPQDKLRSIIGQKKTWRLRPNGAGSGKDEATFDGFITSMSTSFTNDDEPVASEVELRIGPITWGVQA